MGMGMEMGCWGWKMREEGKDKHTWNRGLTMESCGGL